MYFFRFFFGLNEPNIAHDACTTRPGGQSGNCRHLHHCVEQVVNFFSFLQNMCLIQVLTSANSELKLVLTCASTGPLPGGLLPLPRHPRPHTATYCCSYPCTDPSTYTGPHPSSNTRTSSSQQK